MTEISASASKTHVLAAIRQAGAATGASFDFLAKMAARESSLDAGAKAKTSSAAGLFQFIEQTWLGAVKAHGSRHGLGAFASDIAEDARGRFSVASEARRREILDLRFDASAASAMAGELANENRAYLEKRLGRAASSADLYTAHFLGPAGAVKLLAAGAATPAAALLPKAAAANRAVFYEGDRAKTVGEVVASIARSMGAAAPSAPAAEPAPHSVAPEALRLASAIEASSLRDIETPAPRILTKPAAPAAPAIQEPRSFSFSTVALAILQALEPARLGAGREDANGVREDRRA